MDYRKTHGRKNWKYQQNEKHNKRDLKIAKTTTYPSNFWVNYSYDENGKWTPVGQYIKRPKASTMRVYYKKQTSRFIRRTMEDIPNYSGYRKHYEFWWNLD